MMKMSLITSYSLSMALFLGCAQMHPRVVEKEKHALKDLTEVNVEETTKKGAENHELADADADDIMIKQEVGDNDLDEELKEAAQTELPYRKEFLAQRNTKRMQFWVDYFTKQQRDRFQRFLNNGEEYRHHIEQIFKAAGLPKELYYVGLIESGYYLGARSHASAVGPWQFIKGTGKRYGLAISSEIDERQDLFKATKAAAMYFKDLHNIFSSWELALAAYNAGENGIIRRIMKYGTRDFYQLSKNKQLHSETINYVPKVLAAMHVVENAGKYGFILPTKKHRIFDNTELKAVEKNASLSLLSKRLNISSELIRRLNPELRSANTPKYFAGTYYLRVPKDQREWKDTLASTPTVIPGPAIGRPVPRKEINRRTASAPQKEAPQVHVVKRGENLISISRKYKLTPKFLALVNNFDSWKTKLRTGHKLALTESIVKLPSLRGPKIKSTQGPIVYKVRQGDNLTDLARIFNLKVSKIKLVNNLKKEKINVGQEIILPNTQKGIYTVKRGENLSQVARDLKQPLATLIKLNALKRKTIYPGQKIIVNMD